jgi:hypothetical protein
MAPPSQALHTQIAVLLSQGDVHLRSMTFSRATVTMVGAAVALADSFSCPTIKVRETATWNGSVLIENRRTTTHTNSCQ